MNSKISVLSHMRVNSPNTNFQYQVLNFCIISAYENLTLTRLSPAAKYLGDAMSEFQFRFYAEIFYKYVVVFKVSCNFVYMYIIIIFISSYLHFCMLQLIEILFILVP